MRAFLNIVGRTRPEANTGFHSGSVVTKEYRVSRPSENRGFSLVELLSVMAIMAVLSSLAGFAFASIGSSQRVSHALSEMSSLLEFAKMEALTRNTYVWVVFSEKDTGNQYQLELCAALSKNGLSEPDLSNLDQLTKILRFDDLRLVDRSAVESSLRDKARAASVQAVSMAASDFTVEVPASNREGKTGFRGAAITFTPQGEVMASKPTPNSAYDPVMEFCFQQTKGLSLPDRPQEGILLLYGDSAKVRILRPGSW